jgi:hypothetical protein
MKNLLLICIALLSIGSYAQDRIAINDDVSHVVTINRMHYDTVFFTLGPGNQFFTYKQFKTIRSGDKFKVFLYQHPEVFKSDNIELQFTNYCLERYRRQSNTGRALMFIGTGVTMATTIIGWQKGFTDQDALYTGITIGYAVSMLGLIIDLNANHWLKNIQVTGIYQPGLGYVFKF